MGTRTERLKALQAEMARGGPPPRRPPMTRATERRVLEKRPWPMAAVVLRALGLAILVVAAICGGLSVLARSSGMPETFAALWILALLALILGGILCLASLVVRSTAPRGD